MIISSNMSVFNFGKYITNMVANFFPDNYKTPYEITTYVKKALERTEYCFSKIHRKYYNEDGSLIFNYLHCDHMASFLYFLGNTIWKEIGDTEFPTRLFYLNKIKNGLDLYFMVEMPEIFLLVHPIGSIIGNAKYSNYLVVYQNCSIGADESGIYPRFREGTILYSRSSVIGDCEIGSNVVFAANSFIINTNIADNHTVVGFYPNHKLKDNRISVSNRCFNKKLG